MILARLDLARASILKVTLKVSFLRQIFLTRAYRLLAFFLFSLVFNFTLSLKIPLWILLLGPIILGVPHLLSSVRYLPKLTKLDQNFSSQKLYFIIGGIYVAIASVRLLGFGSTPSLIENGPNLIELIGCAVALLIIGLFSKLSKIRVFSAAGILTTLFVMSMKFPLETLGFLVLAHNFIAFFFWFLRAPEKKEKLVALFSLGLFSIVTVGLLTGFFDPWMQARSFEILGGWFTDLGIGSQILPHGDAISWSRAVSAYAFGQGMHYFIWLKAIPEQELDFQNNTSFKTSFDLLKGDMGSKLVFISALLGLGLVIYGLLTNFIEARIVYLSLAALHGYFEIVALSFTQVKSS